jgi:hypothetical protein
VQEDVTIGQSLPKTLPDSEIRRFVETRAAKWFYQNYQYACSKLYYAIDKKAFQTEEWTKYSYITLPCEIQSVSWIYQLRSESLFQLGLNTPNLSVNLGNSQTPYISSYVTTIGELGVYKTLIDSMSDMINQLNKYTTKFHYNQMMNRLNILTKVEYSLVLEAYANIPLENLMTDQYFIKYVTGWAKQQLGNMLGRLDFTLPGNVKYNHSDLVSQGKEEMKEVEDEIKNMSQSSFFLMIKK